MIGGIYSNSNIEDQKEAIASLEESFQDIIDTLYDPAGKTRDDYVKEDMEKNPFFTGMQVPVPPENIDYSEEAVTNPDLLQAMKELDQG